MLLPSSRVLGLAPGSTHPTTHRAQVPLPTRNAPNGQTATCHSPDTPRPADIVMTRMGHAVLLSPPTYPSYPKQGIGAGWWCWPA